MTRISELDDLFASEKKERSKEVRGNARVTIEVTEIATRTLLDIEFF